jgi:hypothetical protein
MMNLAQQMEMKRLTPCMWSLLHHCGRMHPLKAQIGGYVRSANILARRGFISIERGRDGHTARLTEAGHEAVRHAGYRTA